MDKEKNGISENVLWENEVTANRVLTRILFITVIILGILWGLIEFEIFYVEKTDYRIVEAVNVALLILAGTVSIRYRYEKRWIKYVLIATLIFVFAANFALFTYYAVLLMAIPTVVSCRYYSKKLTVIVACITVGLFLIATIYGSVNGMLDLNFLEMPKGTVINFGQETWLSDVLEGVSFDKELMVKDSVIYGYGTRLIWFLLVGIACAHISSQGRKLILRQQELSDHKARVSAELDIATGIQASMLPNRFPAFPDRKELDIYATMEPAREVGGDFYDFYLLDPDHLALVVADVSGKGVPAAFFMMQAKTMIKISIQNDPDPAATLYAVNAMLCDNNDEDMFVTAWLGILELSTGMLTYSDAGHEKLIIRRKGGWEMLPKKGKSAPLAMFDEEDMEDMPELAFRNDTVYLNPQDIILQYTDGVTEAQTVDEEMFGEEGLLKAVSGLDTDDPREILSSVRASVSDFVKDAPQFDDITMLAVVYKGYIL